ncbi:hypothetical protein CU098_013405 [Rhizopus stolonifer]|uniref:D-serine dehydratase n=1 Tax=Rhizopus stolonifer TaxID=4846 RepID=A0A367KW86_RHIST|nr:hypothetical protein CU098_013405 [Rhizopus stolonifer]
MSIFRLTFSFYYQITMQTKTQLLPINFRAEWKETLVREMVGKKLYQLRTPSLVISRPILERNCNRLGKITTELGLNIRVHIKTHKTVEGARIQLTGANSHAIVVSTLPEAYAMIHSDLVLVGFPITPDKFDDVFELSTKVPKFQIFIDNLATLEALEAYYKERFGDDNHVHPIYVFLKIDCGYGRAGVPLNDSKTVELAKRLQNSTCVVFDGMYTHAGHSYSSKSPQEALEYLINECNVARQFRDFLKDNGVDIKYISIGATPTVKAISAFMHQTDHIKDILKDINEVHAGAFAFLDKQQVATGLSTFGDVSISVATRIASVYHERNSVLIDGGALAFSKDTAPQGGFGFVVDMHDKDQQGKPKIVASVTKISQEHGILQRLDGSTLSRPDLQIGSVVRVIPNHCCLAAACHPLYLIVEDDDTVVDVWVPVRGW